MAQTRPAPLPSPQSGSSQSSAAQYPSGTGTSNAMDQKKYSGTITQVDERVGALTIKTSEGQEMKFSVDNSTKINFTGASGRLSGLKTGQQVVVEAKADKAVSIEEFAVSNR